MLAAQHPVGYDGLIAGW